MAGQTSVFKVIYHFENAGKKSSTDYTDYVNSAGGDYNSILTVLTNNGLLRGSGKLVIDAVHSCGPGADALVVSGGGHNVWT
jgi:hypothetical protein